MSPQPPPFVSSGNPIWDEIQQAHSTLSHPAQRAIAMSGIPQRAAEAEAAPLGQSAAEATPPPMRPIGTPSATPIRGLGTPAAATPEAAHLGELNRVTAPPLPSRISQPREAMGPSPLGANVPVMTTRSEVNPLAHTSADTGRSGIGQIHNRFVRGLASVGDAVGSAVLPNVLRFIPGTSLHHQDVVNQNENIVAGDVARAKSGAETAHANAQTEALDHPAKDWAQGSEPETDPAHPEMGPQAVWYNKTDPTQKHFGGAPVAAKPTHAEWTAGPEPEVDPAHPEMGPQSVWYNKQDPKQKQYGNAPVAAKPTAATTHFTHMPGVGLIASTIGKDGKVASEVAYKDDPKTETEITEANGRRLFINKKTGETIKDLGAAKTGGADHGVTMIDPATNKVVRVEPGQAAPTGGVTPAGFNSQNVPTSQTRAMAEVAPKVVGFVDRINALIDDQEKNLGPASSRFREFVAGKVGASDPSYTKLRTDIGLLQTALMRMHVGARGGEQMMEHFRSLIDASKQDPDNLRAALGEIKEYANSVAKGHSAGSVAEQPGSVPEVKTKAEYDALPSGATFMQSGQKRRKP